MKLSTKQAAAPVCGLQRAVILVRRSQLQLAERAFALLQPVQVHATVSWITLERWTKSLQSTAASKPTRFRFPIQLLTTNIYTTEVYLNFVRRPCIMLTGQLADKPTRGQSSGGLDNSRTGQLADSEFLKIMEFLYFICTLNLTLNLTLTLSNIGSV